MRIAVTGGLGFIGSMVVADLVKDGHEVIIVDFWEDLILDYEANRYPILELAYMNIKGSSRLVDPYEFLRRFKELGPHVVVHAGAVVDTTDLGTDGKLWHLNVHYTQQLAQAASEAGAHLVYISSAATYGTKGFPNNPYGLSKLLGEKALVGMKTRVSILRLFNVFGQYEHHKGDMASVPFKLAQAYRTGDTFKMFAPDAARDFVPVANVVHAVREEVTRMHGPGAVGSHRVHDVGTGIATSFSDLDNFVMQATKNTATCCRLIDMPEKLRGRYQGFTRAGRKESPLYQPYLLTREGIEEYYGKQD